MAESKGKGRLYLVPVPLITGADPAESLPEATLMLITSLRIFIAEDLRTARRFLRSSGYAGDFSDIVFHILNKHSTPEEIASMLLEAMQGQNTGLLSEAGVPCVADPGAIIVAAAHQKNIKVVPLVGPSSILMALMASGFNGQSFVFHGYLPVKDPERIKKIREIESEAYRKDQTQIFIETPYRNMQMFRNIIEVCRDETLLCVACNIGSKDETIVSLSIASWKAKQPDFHKKPAVFLIYE